MMSPVTCVTMLMFAGSGLYLYQAKHHAEVETREIRRLVVEADSIRQYTAKLVAESQGENDTETLGKLSARFLPQLKPTQPTQFTSLADFEHRLPPVGLPAPAATAIETGLVFDYPPAPIPATVSAAASGEDGPRSMPAAKPVDMAAKPRPATKPVVSVASRDPISRDPSPGPAAVAPGQQYASSRPSSAAPVQMAPGSTAPGPATSVANASGPFSFMSGAQAAVVSRPVRPSYSSAAVTAPAYPFGAQYASPFGAASSYGGAGPSSGSALGMARGLPHPSYGQATTPPLAPGGSGG